MVSFFLCYRNRVTKGKKTRLAYEPVVGLYPGVSWLLLRLGLVSRETQYILTFDTDPTLLQGNETDFPVAVSLHGMPVAIARFFDR